MVWRPSKATGVLVGLVFILTLVGIDAYLVRRLIGQPIDLNLYFTALLLVLSLPLLALWVYWYAGLITLRYYLDRNGLVISSLGYRCTVPMRSIRGVVSGAQVSVLQTFRGISWPGYLNGRLQLAELGNLSVHSTEPLRRQTIVVTDRGCHGISPRNPAAFAEDLVRRQSFQPVRELADEELRLNLAGLPIWRDRAYGICLALSVLADLILFGWMAARYGSLPSFIPLRVGASGAVARIAARRAVFMLPAIGALTTAANAFIGLAFHRRERLVTYLLLGSMLVVHVVLCLAASRMVGA